MAYISQERKKSLAPAVKAVLKKYGIKGTLATRHYSTLVLNIKEGKIDFFADLADNSGYRSNYIQVNTYWIQDHFKGKAKAFLLEVKEAMNSGNHDNSQPQYDYFDVGWYIDINVGKWNKPYVLTK